MSNDPNQLLSLDVVADELVCAGIRAREEGAAGQPQKEVRTMDREFSHEFGESSKSLPLLAGDRAVFGNEGSRQSLAETAYQIADEMLKIDP